MVGSVVHKTVKFLAKILKPVETFYSAHCFRDSFNAVDKLNRIDYNSGKLVFGSLDVVSLFTNVPIKDCIKVIHDAIEKGDVSVDLDKILLCKLLEICVCDIQFLFDRKYYTQIDGVAMGSPLGPVLANIFVGHIEKHILEASNRDIVIYGRYVDDILVGARSFYCIEELATRLNAVHPNIQFTVEFENDDSISFLDIKIEKRLHNLSLSWYHKETWSGSFLHYTSYVPTSWKTGLLKGFKYRILRICSKDNLSKAVTELTGIFTKNGYPYDFIKDNFIDYTPNKNIKTIEAPKKPVTISLPYLGEERSHIWRRRIKHYVESVYPAVRVAFHWDTTQAIHFSQKDKLAKEDIPGVVYYFACACSENYVGRTECCLRERISQHIPGWLQRGQRCRPRSNKAPESAITRHLMGCSNDTNDAKKWFKIIHKGLNYNMNRILEALEIMHRAPSLCVQKERLFTLKLPWR